MIVCPNCEHPNESFFKFCLRCGSDLSAAPIPAASELVTAEAAASEPVAAESVTEPEDAPGPTEQMSALDEASVAAAFEAADGAAKSPDESLEPADHASREELSSDEPAEDEPVEDDATAEDAPAADDHAEFSDRSAATETLVGAEAPDTDAPSEPVRFTLDHDDPSIPSAPFEPAAAASDDVDTRPCPGCASPVALNHSFCGQCGYRFDDVSPRRSPTGVTSRVPAMAALVVIREDGMDGDRMQLVEGSNVIGRGESTITFASDAFLDPQHAELRVDGRRCILEDLGTLNGTFVRIVEPTQLNHGDMIRLGQELLRYEHLDRVDPIEAAPTDGTELLGAAPESTLFGRLVQVMSPDLVGNAWALEAPIMTIGRERGDILFAGDGYVSGRHATISWRDSQAIIEDLGSSNGTYLQIRGPAELLDGDLVLVGQQLFRFELG